MRIDNLANLTSGKLQNNPAISLVEGFSFSLKNLRPKMAFICFECNEIIVENAINLGAYAIIYENNLKINNKEIAYIKVENLQKSVFRLMRFFCGLNELKFFITQDIIFDIAKTCKGDFKLLRDDIKMAFTQIINAKKGENFISNNPDFIKNFFIINDEILPKKDKIIQNSSLFYTNIILQKQEQSLIFPKIFADEIFGLTSFFDNNLINYKFIKLQNFNHFVPVFVDNNLKVVAFGMSYRAFICENDEEIFIKSAEFLDKNFSQNIITIAPKNANVKAKIYFDNLKEIFNLPNFHYALILCDKKNLLETLNQKPKPQKGLFD